MTAVSSTGGAVTQRSLLAKLRRAFLTPIRAMRLRYLPLLMIYYAYGALGLVAIAEAFWIKEALTLSPAELAAIAQAWRPFRTWATVLLRALSPRLVA